MKYSQTLWLLLLFAWPALTGQGVQEPKNRLLPEGLELRQVEGVARMNETTKAWRFSPHKILSSRNLTIHPNVELTILPSRALDKILSYAGTEKKVEVRIDAVITQYQNANFLFVFDAAPLQTAAEAPSPSDNSQPSQTEWKNILRSAADPNESSVIPPDILRRMKPTQKTDFNRMARTASTVAGEDTMLVNRTGRFTRPGPAGEFILDGFGRNISGQSFVLLPCKTLEQIEQQHKQTLQRPRYRVSGVLTTFRGRTFLLLQGAVRTYTHGNFTP